MMKKAIIIMKILIKSPINIGVPMVMNGVRLFNCHASAVTAAALSAQ